MSPVEHCTHPRARHEHATDAAYKAGCCRCRDCTDASTRAVKRARYARTHGRPGIVAAEPVRAHMRRLVAAGMTVSRIALAAGMRATDGRRIATSTSGVMRRTTAEAILAVTPAPLTVSSVGARRRIQALAASPSAPTTPSGTPTTSCGTPPRPTHGRPVGAAHKQDVPGTRRPSPGTTSTTRPSSRPTGSATTSPSAMPPSMPPQSMT